MSLSLADSIVVIGNGDFEQGCKLIENLGQRLREARMKHPNWGKRGAKYALEAIGGEFSEFMHEVEFENQERQIDEAYDVLATVFRFLNGEHEGAENG